MRGLFGSLLFVFSFALCGCAAGLQGAFSSIGPWRHFPTPAFDFYTDATDDVARAWLVTLVSAEAAERAWFAANFGYAEADKQRARFDVFLFAEAHDYARYAPKQSDGIFMTASDATRPDALLLKTATEMGAVEALCHELAHRMNREAFRGALPVWFDEGLAEYASTIQLRNGEAWIGGVPHGWKFVAEGPPLDHWMGSVPLDKIYRVEELAIVTRADFYRHPWRSYTAAWLLVYTLISDDAVGDTWDSVLDIVREPVMESVMTERIVALLKKQVGSRLEQRMHGLALGDHDVVLSIKYSAPAVVVPTPRAANEVAVNKLSALAKFARGR